jgi:hypothetical protein
MQAFFRRVSNFTDMPVCSLQYFHKGTKLLRLVNLSSFNFDLR